MVDDIVGELHASGCERVSDGIDPTERALTLNNSGPSDVGRTRSEKPHVMATYVYETIPKDPKKKPRQFEVQQKMSDPPLTKHPETGEPVRRVITGGSGWVTHGAGILSMNTRKGRR